MPQGVCGGEERRSPLLLAHHWQGRGAGAADASAAARSHTRGVGRRAGAWHRGGGSTRVEGLVTCLSTTEGGGVAGWWEGGW